MEKKIHFRNFKIGQSVRRGGHKGRLKYIELNDLINYKYGTLQHTHSGQTINVNSYAKVSTCASSLKVLEASTIIIIALFIAPKNDF